MLDYFTRINIVGPVNMVNVNLGAWNNLPTKVQRAVLAVAAQMEDEMWNLAGDMERTSLAKLKANGLNVLDVDPAFRSDLDEMCRKLRSAWVKKAGSEAQAIFDQYAKITGRDLRSSMDSLLHFVDRLNRGMAFAAAVLLGGTVLLILLEIFLWNFFQATTLIADEYSAYALAILVFWGAGLTLYEGGHIRIELILSQFPERIGGWIEAVATAVATGFMGYLLYYLYRMVSSTWSYDSTSGTLTNTPLWIPQGIMLLGALAFFLQLLATTLRSAQKLKSS